MNYRRTDIQSIKKIRQIGVLYSSAPFPFVTPQQALTVATCNHNSTQTKLFPLHSYTLISGCKIHSRPAACRYC